MTQQLLADEFNPDKDTKAQVIEWITPELQTLLDDIPDPWRRKKRNTIIQLVYADLNGIPNKEVFQRKDVCSETAWYTKWSHDKTIKQAYQACLEAAHQWADRDMVRTLENNRRQWNLNVSELSAKTPMAVAAVMSDRDQRGDFRLDAARQLVEWAGLFNAQPTTQSLPTVSQTLNVSQLSDDVILKLLEYARANDTATNSTDSQQSTL